MEKMTFVLFCRVISFSDELADFVKEHIENEADVSIAAKPLPLDQAEGLGLMRVNETLEINEFVEKPTDPKVIADLAVGSGVKSKMKDLIQVITA